MWVFFTNRTISEGAGRRSVLSLAHGIVSYAAENDKVFARNGSIKVPKCEKWVKPVVEFFLKVNCDAAFDPETGSGGWGFIIHDAEGDLVVSGRDRLDYLMDSLHAEIIACLQGAQAAADLGIVRLILETDAMMVRNAILSDEFELSPPGSLMSKLKNVLSLNFLEFSVNFKRMSFGIVIRLRMPWRHWVVMFQRMRTRLWDPFLAVFVFGSLADDCAASE
ncbi:hypothetical protein HU200_015002 [Digitaria exilis]|uniref:RNase H type-1 domain-containing protein n=1 Tax=Digitaria exilis TaxID=1010633 RepID=A0A835FB59_9POAL|nr:hypothetical protein HU200_015002 [Digitaria exilis]